MKATDIMLRAMHKKGRDKSRDNKLSSMSSRLNMEMNMAMVVLDTKAWNTNLCAEVAIPSCSCDELYPLACQMEGTSHQMSMKG